MNSNFKMRSVLWFIVRQKSASRTQRTLHNVFIIKKNEAYLLIRDATLNHQEKYKLIFTAADPEVIDVLLREYSQSLNATFVNDSFYSQRHGNLFISRAIHSTDLYLMREWTMILK